LAGTFTGVLGAAAAVMGLTGVSPEASSRIFRINSVAVAGL
jgi:hypothetical protein